MTRTLLSILTVLLVAGQAYAQPGTGRVDSQQIDQDLEVAQITVSATGAFGQGVYVGTGYPPAQGVGTFGITFGDIGAGAPSLLLYRPTHSFILDEPLAVTGSITSSTNMIVGSGKLYLRPAGSTDISYLYFKDGGSYESLSYNPSTNYFTFSQILSAPGLYSSGDIVSTGNAYLNSDLTNHDTTLFFGDYGGTASAKYLKYDQSDEAFQFSAPIQSATVTANLDVNGILEANTIRGKDIYNLTADTAVRIGRGQQIELWAKDAGASDRHVAIGDATGVTVYSSLNISDMATCATNAFNITVSAQEIGGYALWAATGTTMIAYPKIMAASIDVPLPYPHRLNNATCIITKIYLYVGDTYTPSLIPDLQVGYRDVSNANSFTQISYYSTDIGTGGTTGAHTAQVLASPVTVATSGVRTYCLRLDIPNTVNLTSDNNLSYYGGIGLYGIRIVGYTTEQ